MAKPDNLKYFDFHPVDSKAVRWCDHLINLYRVAVQRIPFISLTMSSATYVWIMIAVVVYLLRRHSWRALAIWVPLLGVLAVCLIGPCNGSTYMRYLYPVIACMPFAIGATITRSDLLWRKPKIGISGTGCFAPTACIITTPSFSGFILQAGRYIITTFVYIARAFTLGFRSKPIGDTYVRAF